MQNSNSNAHKANHHRVVITGMGAITPLGHSVSETWKNLVKGQSGIDYITLCRTDHLPVKFAGEIKDFNPEQFIPAKDVRRMARCNQLALVTAAQAVADAGLTYPFTDGMAERSGVVLGTGMGGLDRTEDGLRGYLERGLSKVNPFSLPAALPNMSTFHVCLRLNAQGYTNTFTTACASGTMAIAESMEIIKRGDCEVMIAGGVEAAVLETTLVGFSAMRAMSTRNDDPTRACRPFDATRDGLVVGEGCAMLVLERLDLALARGARIYAEVLGGAHSSDTHHIAAPDPESRGSIRAMRWALARSGVSLDQVDYINAHGTSTPLGDAAETYAIKSVFGERAYHIPVSSTKSMIGHSFGAGGAIEAVVCAKTIETNLVHPTINYEVPDPKCDLDYVTNRARPHRVDITLSNSFGFGGQNSCLVLSRYKD